MAVFRRFFVRLGDVVFTSIFAVVSSTHPVRGNLATINFRSGYQSYVSPFFFVFLLHIFEHDCPRILFLAREKQMDVARYPHIYSEIIRSQRTLINKWTSLCFLVAE